MSLNVYPKKCRKDDLKFDQLGFTLVELMISIAVVGILSAVAISNFKSYQAKSRTSEAKIQLSALYIAQESFYGEFGIYHYCLSYMGYNPSSLRDSRYYAIGGNGTPVDGTAYAGAVSAGLQALNCPNTSIFNDGSEWFSAGKGVGSSIVDSDLQFALSAVTHVSIGDQSTGATQTYNFAAIGNIHIDFTAPNLRSTFTINQNKQFRIVRPGF